MTEKFHIFILSIETVSFIPEPGFIKKEINSFPGQMTGLTKLGKKEVRDLLNFIRKGGRANAHL